jgi:hypothetical protein
MIDEALTWYSAVGVTGRLKNVVTRSINEDLAGGMIGRRWLWLNQPTTLGLINHRWAGNLLDVAGGCIQPVARIGGAVVAGSCGQPPSQNPRLSPCFFGEAL